MMAALHLCLVILDSFPSSHEYLGSWALVLPPQDFTGAGTHFLLSHLLPGSPVQADACTKMGGPCLKDMASGAGTGVLVRETIRSPGRIKMGSPMDKTPALHPNQLPLLPAQCWAALGSTIAKVYE